MKNGQGQLAKRVADSSDGANISSIKDQIGLNLPTKDNFEFSYENPDSTF